MTFANYSDLQVQIMRLMDGDNVSVSEIETATLTQVIAMAERRIYREVRSRHNEKAFAAVTVSGNVAAYPADWEAASIVHFGASPLIPKPHEWLVDYSRHATGDARYFSETRTGLLFGPAVANGTAVQGSYFCRLPALSAGTFSANALIAAEPDLFLYASLAEGAPFFEKDGTKWEAKYLQLKARVNFDKTGAAYSAGRMRINPSAALIG